MAAAADVQQQYEQWLETMTAAVQLEDFGELSPDKRLQYMQLKTYLEQNSDWFAYILGLQQQLARLIEAKDDQLTYSIGAKSLEMCQARRAGIEEVVESS